jgi:NADH-quinone oxidoreductase subunit M
MNSILTQIILAPFIGAIVALLIPRNYRFVIRSIALVATAVSMVLAIKMFFFDYVIVNNGREVATLTHKIPWVASLGINYHVAVDGLNVGLILMGAIVAFAAVCISRNIKTYEKEFYILLLVMTGGILGAFASFDLFFFYFFHELALVPTFIMIGVWGRGENKNYATFQITLYLSIGALLALVGLIALYLQLPVGSRTFNIVEITKYFKGQPMALAAQQFIFPLLLFGFGILVSLWPFHTWAPLGYGSAPAATAMLHAGVLKKFGLYGLIRIALPLMPEAAQSWMNILAILCLGNIVYCGFAAMRQRDLNLLIGNSSVAHMGFCFLGIASLSLIGVTGAVTVMIAHGLLAALTFALSGYLYQQTGTLDMDKMGGLLRQIPFIGAVLVMAAMAGCGLPGFANFPGEALVLFGAWKTFPVVTAIAVWGALVIGAIYMLRAVRNILHGPLAATPLEPRDAVTLWRKFPYALLLASLLLFGFVPSLLTDKIKPTAQAVVEMATSQPKIKKAEKIPRPQPCKLQ